GWINDISVAHDGQTTAVVLSSLVNPAELWVGRVADWNQITHFSDGGARPRPAKIESLHWQSDNWRIQGWLTYPLGYDPNRKYPMVVYVHGGPSGMIGASCGQAYAAAGYFTLCPNFRGSAGFGEDFIRADEQHIGFADYRDI